MRHVDFDGTGRLSQPRQALTDLDFQALIRPDDLTPSADQIIASEYLTTGNKRGWQAVLRSTGALRFRWSTDGASASTMDSTVALTTIYADGDKFWVRYVFDVNNGAAGKTARFYTSDDGVAWTQLGADVTTAGTTSIFSDAGNVITLAGEGTAANYTGKVYATRLYSTIGGSANLVDPEPWDWSTATYGASGVTFVTPGLSATVQDSWPPRVLLSATDIETDDSVTLYRVVGTDRTAVRAASDVVPGDTAMVRTDGELPFATALSYVMVLGDSEEYTYPASGSFTVDLPGGKVALSDAITGLSAEVVTYTWPERRYERPSTRFVVGGRNVLVLGQLPGFSGTIDVGTEADVSAENVRELLAGATEGVIQYRSATQPQHNAYLAVPSYTEVRGQDGTDARRRFVLDVVEVEPWAADVEAAGVTYQNLQDAYDGLTYNDLAGDYATYLALAQADFT